MATIQREASGIGLYSPAEAAWYARVRTAKFRRWLYGEHAVFQPQLGESSDIVTFLDFAQSLSIQDIRLTAQISLQKIRKAYEFAQKHYKVEYPFGVKHGMFVFGDLKHLQACELGIFLPDDDKADVNEFIEREARRLQVQISGKNKGQYLISPIVQSFSKKLVFNEDSGLASEYCAYEGFGHRILMSPEIRFGKPYLENVGYEAQTLVEAVEAERGEERASRLYRVDVNAVRAAMEFNKLLKTEPPKQPKKPAAA